MLSDTIITTCAIVLFGTWLLVTIIYALPDGGRVVAKLGVLRPLIPSWNFFAPRPGIHNYYLLYRDQWPDGTVSVWRQVVEFESTHRLLKAVWNPHKIEKKVIFDVVQQLSLQVQGAQDNLDALKLIVPYLVILNYVSSLPRTIPSIATQFLIMRESRVDGTLEPYFISGLHRL